MSWADIRQEIQQFPYYIVRFKPGIQKIIQASKESFHTT